MVVFFKYFWIYFTEHRWCVVWHQLSLWYIVQKALTLITSSWVTVSIAWMTALGGWYVPVVRAWAPISSNKMSELSIDIKYSVFTWVLHMEEISEHISMAVPVELHHGNLLSNVTLWSHFALETSASDTFPSATPLIWATAAWITYRKGRQQGRVKWNLDADTFAHF